jgi:hypothetical protein
MRTLTESNWSKPRYGSVPEVSVLPGEGTQGAQCAVVSAQQVHFYVWRSSNPGHGYQDRSQWVRIATMTRRAYAKLIEDIEGLMQTG